MITIVVAFSSNFGIGKSGSIPWNIPADLNMFKKITKETIVIMGRLTWESLPKKPLPNRFNVVVTSGAIEGIQPDKTVKIDELDDFISENTEREISIIGGTQLYERFMGRAELIFTTQIMKKYDCDTYFPLKNFDKYELSGITDIQTHEEIKYRHILYSLAKTRHEEYTYLDLLTEIHKGANRPDRTNVGTRSVFGKRLEFNISDTIPIITTKQTAFRAIVTELLFFLRGDTDSKILEKEGVNIWKGNTTREFLDSRGLFDYAEGEMGPMYGHNWRAYGESGTDQLEKLIEGLKTDPYSRRHLMTTYDPDTVDKCVLAPCHGLITQFYISDTGALDCQTYCRSSDTFLGLPFNIASYAILTRIIAKKCGLEAGKLIMILGDAHLYLSHLAQYEEIIIRNPLPFPYLNINDSVVDKKWEEITPDDIQLVGYLHWPRISAEVAI